MRILLVNDDERLVEMMATMLRRHGHEVVSTCSFESIPVSPRPDLILLDLWLARGDGIAWLRCFRATDTTPVIVVTRRDTEAERLRGLWAGADDYVVTPFSFAELNARMNALIRRSRYPARAQLRLSDLVIDVARRTVQRQGREIALTRKEFDLLLVLVRAGGMVVCREQILAEVWSTTWKGVARTLEVHVSSLRHKLGSPDIVRTVRGVGYGLSDRVGAPAHSGCR
ncbi:response regulator transcription factor [Saccharomonospora xinjiangensis]|uniref:Sensory transduction protein RegX3 n=1 Tax=Saccharomonospora xinjiangensis XJ-54 TaxID=882086 RepID=I0V8X7_9PSEU|nr:response regulator transcription factor [Saccharomonospora xinjiangensis]EID56580.1 response regulator with CheY-like receiver domain and winged-helix DNA-binding domain [Saccharomonospora xinjiangensis XJ-54]